MFTPRFLALLLTAFLSAFLSACASKHIDMADNWSTNKIYAEAKDEINTGNWESAIRLLDKLEGRAAGTPLAQQAQLERAYVHHKQRNTAEALATLDRFMKLHPASPAMDYAFYLKGLINFNDDLGMFAFISRQDLSERDQNATKEAYEAFKELIARFPSSRYAADASERLAYAVNSMAKNEVHVARYYYQRGAYVAAINRAQTAVTEFKTVPAVEEALFIMLKSYEQLGLKQLRDDTERILKLNYPQSAYLGLGPTSSGKSWWKFW